MRALLKDIRYAILHLVIIFYLLRDVITYLMLYKLLPTTIEYGSIYVVVLLVYVAVFVGEHLVHLFKNSL